MIYHTKICDWHRWLISDHFFCKCYLIRVLNLDTLPQIKFEIFHRMMHTSIQVSQKLLTFIWHCHVNRNSGHGKLLWGKFWDSLLRLFPKWPFILALLHWLIGHIWVLLLLILHMRILFRHSHSTVLPWHHSILILRNLLFTFNLWLLIFHSDIWVLLDIKIILLWHSIRNFWGFILRWWVFTTNLFLWIGIRLHHYGIICLPITPWRHSFSSLIIIVQKGISDTCSIISSWGSWLLLTRCLSWTSASWVV